MVPLLIAACENEEGRMRKRIAGEYVADIDEVERGERRREHHVLTISDDGLWKRGGWAVTNGQRRDLFRDSGHYRIQGKTLVMRSHVEEVGPIKFTITGDILHGSAAPMPMLAARMGIGQGRFIRSR
jgi:hypothetical protein